MQDMTRGVVGSETARGKGSGVYAGGSGAAILRISAIDSALCQSYLHNVYPTLNIGQCTALATDLVRS
jgi:hypothetical protein